jgi:hypothetical protein
MTTYSDINSSVVFQPPFMMLVLLFRIINFKPSNDSLLIEPVTSQQLVAFQSMGKIIHTWGYAHLQFQIDLDCPIRQLKAFSMALDGQTANYYRDNSKANWCLTIDLQKQHLEVLLC